MINEELQPLGLSSAEGNILFHLLTQDKIFVQDELVGQLDISKPAVSRALQSLEEKGYIIREKHPTDKRANQIRLTAAAQETSRQVIRIYEEIFATAAAGIPAEQVADFIQLFQIVSEQFTTTLSAKREQKRQTS
jgi:DNA-binding MarR family transcriptional regulator